MLNTLLLLYGHNLDFARRLVADIAPEQMCAQMAERVNHPAWVLGHLALTSDGLISHQFFKQQAVLPEAWRGLFGPGSVPRDDPAAYPAKDELVEALAGSHRRVEEALRAQPEGFERQPVPHEAFAKRFPTLEATLTLLMVGHEQMHLGQLSAWRRVRGLPAV